MASHKLAFVVVDAGIETDVMAVLEGQGIKHYTRWTDAFGAGETGVKQGTPIWPGLNTVLMIHVSAEKIDPLVETLHALRDTFQITPGMKIFVVDGQML